ncbi:hypothetical protein NMG60_11014420 [Bertholletia excelsa]
MSRERERYEEVGKKIKREGDATSSISPTTTSSSSAAMGVRRQTVMGPSGSTTSLNTITPCAACKLLRRRCAEECPFSPYFSPHEPHKFAAVHKVFGASNVSKMLLEVPESQRADAANSLVYEANVRLRDPVYGCMGAISALQHQVQTLQTELNVVRAEILKYKYREAASTMINAPLVSSGAVSVAALPSVAAAPPPAPLQMQRLPPPPPSIVVASSSSSSADLYTSPVASTAYNSIPSDNVPFF